MWHRGPSEHHSLGSASYDEPRLDVQPPAIDLQAIARATQALTRSAALEDVVREVTTRVVQLSGSHRAALLLAADGGLQVVADPAVEGGPFVSPPRRLASVAALPHSVIHYVERTLRPVQLSDDEDAALRTHDPYFNAVRPASVLAVPLVFIGALQGVLYLEHHTARQAFDDEVGLLVEFVATQAAIAIRNAVLVERLVRERERYASFMTIAQDGVHLLDEKDRLVEANDAFLRMLGRSQDAVGTLAVHEWDAELQAEGAEEAMRAILDQPKLFRTRYRRSDGAEFEVEMNAGGVTLEGQRYVLGAPRDMTARREFERRLEELNRSLEERIAAAVAELRTKDQLLITQSRHAAMGEMLGSIAHQWRQPLNALGLVLANLQDGDVDAHVVPDFFEQGKRLIEKMSSTIRDFSDFFRPKKEKRLFAAGAQIRETVSLVHASYLHYGLSLELVLDDRVSLFGFANEYSQVVLNLLSNAKQAIRTSGVAEGRVVVRLTQRDGIGELSVEDNGGGVPGAIIDRIFEPYFSTREGGTGIGLFMSRKIVEQSLGGRLEVRNEGAGAVFTVLTPLATASFDHTIGARREPSG